MPFHHIEQAARQFEDKDPVEKGENAFQAMFSAVRREYLELLVQYRKLPRERAVQKERNRLYREIKSWRREGRREIQEMRDAANVLKVLRGHLQK